MNEIVIVSLIGLATTSSAMAGSAIGLLALLNCPTGTDFAKA
jgi:hypothetical protein